jgi:hypothetical protein
MLKLVRAAGLFIAVCLGAPAAAAADRPGDYETGGIGVDEIERLAGRETAFNLKLVFTLAEGNYVSDVAVVVRDMSGKRVLVTLARGPVFLAKLPRATYVVDATYEGRTRSRRIDVGGPLRIQYLRWPSNPNTDTVLAPENMR